MDSIRCFLFSGVAGQVCSTFFQCLHLLLNLFKNGAVAGKAYLPFFVELFAKIDNCGFASASCSSTLTDFSFLLSEHSVRLLPSGA